MPGDTDSGREYTRADPEFFGVGQRVLGRDRFSVAVIIRSRWRVENPNLNPGPAASPPAMV